MSSNPKVNDIGLTRKEYLGSKSTLCIGCGHDSISNNIITACYQAGVEPHNLAKMSGIGCSSKTPAYFLNLSPGFNTIHGRLAPVSTGVKIANRNLTTLGVSGDGDTASIGLGSFIHLLRRNLPMIYIIENNGVYGLTKGQFSATADKGSMEKGGANRYESIDLCTLALEMGCSFVARSFSGDSKQLVPLLNAALRHNGTSVIDIVSPCVTFNNHEGSTKSYDSHKAYGKALQDLGFIQPKEEKTVDYEEGTIQEVELHDGSKLILKKIDSTSYPVDNVEIALKTLRASRKNGEMLTGLLYLDTKSNSLVDKLDLCEKPLAELSTAEVRPSKEVLNTLLKEYR